MERFEHIRELGRGGMGSVRLVFDRLRGEGLAQKRVLGHQAEAVMRFKREFRAVEALAHPRLVRLYELGEDEEGLYFLMEALDGTDLVSYCRSDEGALVDVESGPMVRADAYAQTEDVAAPTASPMALAETMVQAEAAETRPMGFDVEAVEVEGRRDEGLRRGRPPHLNYGRLRHVLPQLFEALAFLHDQGLVHRDLKPANIIICRDGSLKLLDFGILGEKGDEGDRLAAGTVGYISPEQLREQPPHPSNDLYALGAILFELVSGHLPHESHDARRTMLLQLQQDAPRLDEVVDGAPAVLVEACAGLLSRDPGVRPGLAELGRSLLPGLGAPRWIRPAGPARKEVIVGRVEERAMLEGVLVELRNGKFVTLALMGASGTGKSALAQWTAQEARAGSMEVVFGRGRANDRVPFNVFDGVIDGVATLMKSRGASFFGSSHIVGLRRVARAAFPVFDLEDDLSDSTGLGRRIVFDAVSRLLEEVAAEVGGLLIVLDDVQWADRDCLALIEHVATLAPARVGIVATLRNDVEDEGKVLEGLEALGTRMVELCPLGEEELVEIIETNLALEASSSGLDRQVGGDVVRDLARHCQGRPFLAEIAGRALRLEEKGFDLGRQAGEEGVLLEAVARMVQGLGEEERRLLTLLVTADEWLTLETFRELTSFELGPLDEMIARMAGRGLLRVAGTFGLSRAVDFYHDLVRRASSEGIDEEERRRAHGLHAHRLEVHQGPSHRLVRHLIGAGDRIQAAHHAREAAEEARRKRAYGLAVEMYRVALGHDEGDRAELLEALAHALESSGRYQEAAKCWGELAELSEEQDRVNALISRAHALLAADEVALGQRQLVEVGRLRGEPMVLVKWWHKLVAGLRFLKGPGMPSVASTPALLEDKGDTSGRGPGMGSGAEQDIRLGTMIGYFDPLEGVVYLLRARRSFEGRGQLREAAWCNYLLAYFAMHGTRKARGERLARRYVEVANRQAALGQGEDEHFQIELFPAFLEGVLAQRQGRWREGAEVLDGVLEGFAARNITGTFEHLMVHLHRAQIDFFAQDIKGFEVSLEQFRRVARDTGDSAMRSHIVFLEALQLCLQGRFEEGCVLLEPLMARLAAAPPTFQHGLVHVFYAMERLYLSDGRERRRELAKMLHEHRYFRFMDFMYSGWFASICALTEANALRSGDPDASARRVAHWASIAEGCPGLNKLGAMRALAYAADATGAPERALALLEEAEQAAREAGLPLDEAIAMYGRGRRLGGEEGERLVAAARAMMEARGVSIALLEEDYGLR